MLTFDPNILDPERREAAVAGIIDGLGLDEDFVDPIVAILNIVSEANPETNSQAIEILTALTAFAVVTGYSNGVGIDAVTGLPAIADIATPDANDLATAITLANANKAKTNALLAAFRVAGILTT